MAVHKLDCVGHVQKRMGKRLLNLKSVTKGKLSDGKTICAYSLAIQQNVLKITNPTANQKQIAVYQMKKNIMAILSHIIKRNDQLVQHCYCPVVLESWFGWQRNEVMKKSGFKGTT